MATTLTTGDALSIECYRREATFVGTIRDSVDRWPGGPELSVDCPHCGEAPREEVPSVTTAPRIDRHAARGIFLGFRAIASILDKMPSGQTQMNGLLGLDEGELTYAKLVAYRLSALGEALDLETHARS